MYNPQITYERVKELSRVRKISISEINKTAGISENTISQSAKRSEGMGARNLYEIAQCLDCSVDYLLDRSDNPQSHKCPIAFGDISNNNGVIGGIANSAPVTINNGDVHLSQNAVAMLEIFNTLDTMNQAELLVYANKLKNENSKFGGTK